MSEPIRNLSAADLYRIRFGTGAYDRAAKALRDFVKEAKQAQRGKSFDGEWELALSVPTAVYFAMEDIMPGCWEPDNQAATMAWIWENFEDMRASDARSNPFRRRQQLILPSHLSTTPSPVGSVGP